MTSKKNGRGGRPSQANRKIDCTEDNLPLPKCPEKSDTTPPKAVWKIFLRLTDSSSNFIDIYLMCRGSAKSPRFSLVWAANEKRWVQNGELRRAQVKAGGAILQWAADRVSKAVFAIRAMGDF